MPSGTPNSGERAKTERVSPPFSLIQGLLIHFMAKGGMATTDIATALGVHRSYVIRSTEVVFEPENDRERSLLALAADYLPKFQNLGLKGLLSGTNISTTLAGGEREKLGSLEERRAARAANPKPEKAPRKPKVTPALSAEPVSTEAGVAEAKPKGKRGGAKAPAAEPTAAPVAEVPAADPPARGRRRGGASTPAPEAAQAPAATAADPEAGMSALERRRARKAAQDAAQPVPEPAPEPTAAQSALERRRARKQAVPA